MAILTMMDGSLDLVVAGAASATGDASPRCVRYSLVEAVTEGSKE